MKPHVVTSHPFASLRTFRAGGFSIRALLAHVSRGALRACGIMTGFWLVAGAPLTPPLFAAGPPPMAADIGRYQVFAENYLEWGGAAQMPDDAAMGVNAGSLLISADTGLPGDGSYAAAPSADLQGRTELNALYANSVVLGAEVRLRQGAALAYRPPIVAAKDYPRVPNFNCGSDDVTVDASNSPYVLPPGVYGVVTVTSGRRLDLLPEGAYVFCSLRLRGDAVLGIHGSNRIYVSDYVSTGVRVSIAGEGACSALWIARGERLSPAPQSAAFDFGGGGPQNRSLIQGRFFTPAKIAMAQHNDYVGDFWAAEVSAPAADRITRTLSACRASYCGDGIVDPGESCDDGNNLDGDCCSAFCTVRDPGSACDDGLFCTGLDYCDADGQCRGSGDPCPGPDGDGDCSESCNEASDSCTKADVTGSPCDDGDMCTAGGSCHAGLCRGEEPLDCSDGDLCTYDYCDPRSGACNNYYAPDPHCRFAGSSFTRLEVGFSDQGRAKASSFMSRRRLAKGLEATSYAELGDPTLGDEYALCVYDSYRQDPELVYRLDLSPESVGDLSAWRRRETRSKLVYRLKLPEGSSQGVSKAKLALDKDYALSLFIKAGANPGCGAACRAKFEAPPASSSESIFAMDPSVVFQWTASTGACWSSEYLAAKANSDSEFRASTR